MSTKTVGRIVGALILISYVVYLTGSAMVGSAAGTPVVLAGVIDNQVQLAAGALLMLLNSIFVIGIGVLAFPILKARHEITAHAYLVTRVFEGVTMALGVLGLLLLIPLARAGGGSTLQPLAGLAQEWNQYALHVAMIALGLGSVLFCLALFRARLVPRILAVLGLVGYPVMAAGEVLAVLGYGVGMVHYAPGLLFEVALGVLLVVKGFPAGWSMHSRVATVADQHV